QVLTNLLDNALKFTHQGSIEFGCNVRNGSVLEFFVKDTGIGIPANKQEIIFDRFRQANETMSKHLYGGSGLGLAISKGIAGLMKGKIWLESKENEGTTFFFAIPFKQTKIKSSHEKESAFNPRSWKNKTVLIVEDDDANAEYLKELFADTGLKCLFASTGEQALYLFRNTPAINLVLMDIRLPDTNGLGLTRIIKKERPTVVVIAQTAYASSSDMEECIDAGCSNYIAKPVNSNKLFKLMEHYFNKQS
ncbi:MAG TPA: ATP-binding protein, partial [Bacteroidales bacterium]|nr:ATP-binding protein [Bacteroidales bacterium]